MAQKILMDSAVRTASGASDTQTRSGETGLHVIINMLVVPGVQTVTFKIQGRDAKGNWYDLLTSAAIVAVSQVILKIRPDFTAAANTVANDGIPDEWRVTATHSGGGNFTYNVCANTLD